MRVGSVFFAAALWVGATPGRGQTISVQGCLTPSEYDPVLVANPEGRVSFGCSSATAYQAIQAAGRQVRVPIGIVLGRDTHGFLVTLRSFSLHDVDLETALREALQGTGYVLQKQGEVWVVVAGDLTKRQLRLLHLQLSNFGGQQGSSLSFLGQDLTMWMQAKLHPGDGYALGGLYSINEESFTFPVIASATTEEIANRIVQLGPKGMWVLRADPVRHKGRPSDVVEIESYQHYSNRPIW